MHDSSDANLSNKEQGPVSVSIPSFQVYDSNYKDYTIVRLSYIYIENPSTGNTVSLMHVIWDAMKSIMTALQCVHKMSLK